MQALGGYLEEIRFPNAKKVLYVEDEALVRLDVAHFLRRFFAEVYEASNGRQGLELYRHVRPDLVITDIEMPVMNGVEMLKKILQLDCSQSVIVISGHTDQADIRTSELTCLVKPVDFDELRSAIAAKLGIGLTV